MSYFKDGLLTMGWVKGRRPQTFEEKRREDKAYREDDKRFFEIQKAVATQRKSKSTNPVH